MRSLYRMANAKRMEAWDHTAAILSKIHNVSRGKGKRAIFPNQINPYRRRKKVKQRATNKESRMLLHRVFGTGKNNGS